MTAARIVVVGSYVRDLGIVLPRFPRPGETVIGSDLLESHGGKGSNQAIQAARCGAAVTMIASVGDDGAGAAACALWRSEGVEAGVAPRSGAATGAALIVVDAAGQNQIAFAPGANRQLQVGDVERNGPALAAAGLVLAQLETPVEATLSAFALASRHGATTLLNAAPATDRMADALWQATDILVVNELEAAALAGRPVETPPAALAAILVQRIRQAVIVTVGAAGAWLLVPSGRPLHVPSLSIDAVDTTGAGDAFIGAFAVRWLETGDLQAAMRWGVVAGALACTARGVVPALAGRATIAGYGAG